MLDTIGGIPIHPLIVHAVVVLVPLASLLLLLAALSPPIRRWAGLLTPLLATLALVLTPLASQSGEALQRRVAESPALEEHTELGDTLVFYVFLVAVLAWVLWFLDRRARATAATGTTAADGVPAAPPRSALLTGVIVLSVLAVLATTVQVVRIGHSGAEASWSKVGATTPTGGEGGDD
ncbi:MAG: DUF2231 domain-containing protein [Ornithinibacter sp.]